MFLINEFTTSSLLRCLNFYLYEVKEDLEIFFFEYLVALCLPFREYSILNLRIVTLRDTILQTYLVQKHKLEPGLDSGIWTLDSGLWTLCICEVTGVGG